MPARRADRVRHRHLPAHHRRRRRGARRPLRALDARRRPAPADGRPRPRPHFHHPRERPALGQQAGLRHPPAAATRRPGRLPDGPPRAVLVQARAHDRRGDGAALPGGPRERAKNPDRHPRGGGAVPPQPRGGPPAAERRLPEDPGGGLGHRRRSRGVRPALDVWHPGRGHGGARGRPEPAGRHGRLRGRARRPRPGLARQPGRRRRLPQGAAGHAESLVPPGDRVPRV